MFFLSRNCSYQGSILMSQHTQAHEKYLPFFFCWLQPCWTNTVFKQNFQINGHSCLSAGCQKRRTPLYDVMAHVANHLKTDGRRCTFTTEVEFAGSYSKVFHKGELVQKQVGWSSDCRRRSKLNPNLITAIFLLDQYEVTSYSFCFASLCVAGERARQAG